jgi:tight adherence protein B
MASVLLVFAVFAIGAGVVLGLYALVTYLPGALERRRIEARMRDVGPQSASPEGEATLIKRAIEGPLPAVDRLAGRTRYGPVIGRMIEQSGSRISVSSVLVGSLACGLAGGVGVAVFLRAPWAPLVGFALGGSLPFLILSRKRKSRLGKFEEQFPEALDLLSRAIRAGHALTTAIGMVADEAREPIGPEFRKTYDEQNFGLPLKDALNNLSTRVPLLDVRFFVTAVLIQRETGGNLSEILDNLANVVRERFKILRQVRVHTAHGRFTGYVLVSLPPALAIVLSFINPDHIGLLFKEHLGQMMLTAAILLEVIGYLWIKRVIKIEV